jgi:hypothetical protein
VLVGFAQIGITNQFAFVRSRKAEKTKAIARIGYTSAQPAWGFDAMQATRLEGLDVLQSVEDAPSDLQEGRPRTQPAPAFQSPGAQAPAAGEFDLVEMLDHDSAPFLGSVWTARWGSNRAQDRAIVGEIYMLAANFFCDIRGLGEARKSVLEALDL